MADHPLHLIVTGLGRCGTTMVMTMLDAGGFPVSGPRPSYEVPAAFGPGRADPVWIEAQAGRAIKVIDPTACPITRHPFSTPPVVICLKRDAKQQAKSQLRFADPDHRWPPHQIGAMKRSLEQDTPRMVAALRTLTPHLYVLPFETVLASPYGAAALLETISMQHFGRTFDAIRAGRMVLDRPKTAMTDHRIEQHILPTLAQTLLPETHHA